MPRRRNWWHPAATRQFAATLLLFLTLLSPGLVHAETSTPESVVRQFYAVLLHSMKLGPTVGPRGRYDMLMPAVKTAFDLPSMARLAVGFAWDSMTAPQRQQLEQALGRYTAATYAQNFDSWSGERFDVTGTQKSPYGVIVLSRIVPTSGDPTTINYLMRQNNGPWQIADVYLTGTISQLANLRAQFSSVVQRQGAQGLIAALNHKADMLVANAGQ